MSAREPSAGERAYLGAERVESPANVEELSALLREGTAAAGGATENAAPRWWPAGHGAHVAAANPVVGARVVSVEHFADVIDYEPDDFTIGVGAGMPNARLQELLAKNGQELPADLPATGTIGGAVARGHCGPRFAGGASLSTLVLGVEGVRFDGAPFRSGGMVVKNVAGYQLHKYVVGTDAPVAFLTRINLRLSQRPAARELTRREVSIAEAPAWLGEFRARRLEPEALVLVASSSTPGLVTAHWMFEGSEPRVAWRREQLGDLAAGGKSASTRADGDRSLHELGEQLEPPADPAAPVGLVRLGVLPTDVPATLSEVLRTLRAGGVRPAESFAAADARSGLVTVRWATETAEEADGPLPALANLATSRRGHVRVLHLPAAVRARSEVRPTPGPAAALRARVRAAFDPAGGLR